MSRRPGVSRILVVDDEALIADTLALILNENGFEATAVYSGEQAVQVAATLKPDVLISDINMGELSGVDAAILIRKHVPQCNVLLISARALPNDLPGQTELESHRFAFLDKPFHPGILLSLLSSRR